MVVKILSGGAANGLVTALTERFVAATGQDLTGEYGAVGGMRDRVTAGEAVDVIILTRAIIDDLAASGHVVLGSVTDLGQVVTGVGIREQRTLPDVSSAEALREVMAGATALYVPDTRKATAGIHVAGVLRALGLEAQMADRLREFPNGQMAMAAMVAEDLPGAVGSTQVTEILNTLGVAYAGDLPGEFALSTVYTAAVSARAAEPDAAATLIGMLAAPEHMATRQGVGFS